MIANGTDITCCTSTGGSINSSLLYPACLPISIPIDDKFWNQPVFVRDCLNFVRSIAGPRLDCSLGYADQVLFYFQTCTYLKQDFFINDILNI